MALLNLLSVALKNNLKTLKIWIIMTTPVNQQVTPVKLYPSKNQPFKQNGKEVLAMHVIEGRIWCGGKSGDLRLLDPSSMKLLEQHALHSDGSAVTSIFCTVYDKKTGYARVYAANGSNPIYLRVKEQESDQFVNKYEEGFDGGNGEKRIVGQSNPDLVVFYRNEGNFLDVVEDGSEEMSTYQLPYSLTAFDFCEDDRWFAGDEQGTIYEFKEICFGAKQQDFKPQKTIELAHEGPVYAVKFHQGLLFSSGKSNGINELRVWQEVDEGFTCTRKFDTDKPAIDFGFLGSEGEEWEKGKICALLAGTLTLFSNLDNTTPSHTRPSRVKRASLRLSRTFSMNTLNAIRKNLTPLGQTSSQGLD